MNNTTKLSRVLSVLIFVFALQSAAFAKDEWIRVQSKNFNLIGNASEKDIRKVATKLEQFRETFRQIFKLANLNAPQPTNVVVFKSDSAYKPFKPKRADGKTDTNIAGYFQPGEDVNYITLSTEGEDADTFGTIYHEYVHYVVNSNFGKSDVPPWFNEGLAEYYQTFAIEEDQKVKLGIFQQSHINLLAQTKMIPLDTLFNINQYSLTQNGNHSRSIFYAQSWALIHYLIQGGKIDGLGKFLTALMNKTPPEKAFQDSFQTSYAQMEKELRKYVEQSSYKYQILTFKNKLTFDADMKVTPLAEADTNAYLGDLLFHTHRRDEAETYLQNAVAADPNQSMANTTLGMVKFRRNEYAEALKYLEKAVAAGNNHLANYYYAYALSRGEEDSSGFISGFPAENKAKMRESLKKSIQINPYFAPSYDLLAFIGLVSNENLDEAVQLLQRAQKIDPGNLQFTLRIAEIYLRQEKFDEAKAIARKVAETADDPQIKSRAEYTLSNIASREEMTARYRNAKKEYEDSARNGERNVIVIQESADGKPLTPEEIKRIQNEAKNTAINQALYKPQEGQTQILGRIQKIACANGKITFAVKTETELLTLTSKDFANLAMTALTPEVADMQIGCGASVSNILTVITYKNSTAAKSAGKGEVIAIDFVPSDFKFVGK